MKPKLRILIYLFLIGLGFIGIFINAVWGNPVSKVVAKIQVNNFIKENFNNRELKVYKIEYNLINSGYVAEIIDNKTKLSSYSR